MVHDQHSGGMGFGNQLDQLIVAPLRQSCRCQGQKNKPQRMAAANLLNRAMKNDVLVIGLGVQDIGQT